MDRSNIYYWKCDRAAAFHGTSDYEKDQSDMAAALDGELSERFGSSLSDLMPGQGSHRTFRAKLDGKDVFIRIGGLKVPDTRGMARLVGMVTEGRKGAGKRGR